MADKIYYADGLSLKDDTGTYALQDDTDADDTDGVTARNETRRVASRNETRREYAEDYHGEFFMTADEPSMTADEPDMTADEQEPVPNMPPVVDSSRLKFQIGHTEQRYSTDGGTTFTNKRVLRLSENDAEPPVSVLANLGPQQVLVFSETAILRNFRFLSDDNTALEDLILSVSIVESQELDDVSSLSVTTYRLGSTDVIRFSNSSSVGKTAYLRLRITDEEGLFVDIGAKFSIQGASTALSASTISLEDVLAENILDSIRFESVVTITRTNLEALFLTNNLDDLAFHAHTDGEDVSGTIESAAGTIESAAGTEDHIRLTFTDAGGLINQTHKIYIVATLKNAEGVDTPPIQLTRDFDFTFLANTPPRKIIPDGEPILLAKMSDELDLREYFDDTETVPNTIVYSILSLTGPSRMVNGVESTEYVAADLGIKLAFGDGATHGVISGVPPTNPIPAELPNGVYDLRLKVDDRNKNIETMLQFDIGDADVIRFRKALTSLTPNTENEIEVNDTTLLKLFPDNVQPGNAANARFVFTAESGINASKLDGKHIFTLPANVMDRNNMFTLTLSEVITTTASMTGSITILDTTALDYRYLEANVAPEIVDGAPDSFVAVAQTETPIDLTQIFNDRNANDTLSYTITAFEDKGYNETPLTAQTAGLTFRGDTLVGTFWGAQNYIITVMATDDHTTPESVSHRFSFSSHDYSALINSIAGSDADDTIAADDPRIAAEGGNVFHLQNGSDSVAALSVEGMGHIDTIISPFAFVAGASRSFAPSTATYGTVSGSRNFELGIDRIVLFDDDTRLTNADRLNAVNAFELRIERGRTDDNKVDILIAGIRLNGVSTPEVEINFNAGIDTIRDSDRIISLFGVGNLVFIGMSDFVAPSPAANIPIALGPARTPEALTIGANPDDIDLTTIDMSGIFTDANVAVGQTIAYSFTIERAITGVPARVYTLAELGMSHVEGTNSLVRGIIPRNLDTGAYTITITATENDTTGAIPIEASFVLNITNAAPALIDSAPTAMLPDAGGFLTDITQLSGTLTLARDYLQELFQDETPDELTITAAATTASAGIVSAAAPAMNGSITLSFTRPVADHSGAITLIVSDGVNDAISVDIGFEITGAPNRTAVGAVSFTAADAAADAQLGTILTADISGVTDADGIGTFAYQWLRSGTDIAGATGNTYSLQDDDFGNPITLRVTHTDARGIVETLASTTSYSPPTNTFLPVITDPGPAPMASDITLEATLTSQGKSGSFVYTDANTNDDIVFYIARGGAPASGEADARDFVRIDAKGFTFEGKLGTLSLGEPTTNGILTWSYLAKTQAHAAAQSESFTIRTTDERVINHAVTDTYVSPEQYITIGLARSTSAILTNKPEGTEIVVPLVPTASDTGKKNDAGYKITENDMADAAQVIVADQAPDVLIASAHGDRIDAGRGIDEIKLAAVAVADTVYYTIDATGSSWVAYDGADTIENFERGVDKLALALRVSGDVATAAGAGETYYDDNAGGNVDLRPIYSVDGTMVSGIELVFGVSGGSYGGISTGNILTINFAAPLATVDYAELDGLSAILGGTEMGAMDVFDVNFEVVAANNAAEVARGSELIDAIAVARVGVDISVDLTQISDADGLSEALADEATRFSYQWVRLDSVGLDDDIASFALSELATIATHTPDAVDVGDFIRVIVSFRDDVGNAESVSSDAVRIIPALDDDVPPPLDML